jgi:hypothetical protein
VQKQGNHGEAFGYQTVNTEVLAWILTRTTGRTLAQLTSERIWSRLGAERDAFYTVDGIGTAWGGGGLGQIAVRGSDEADIRAKRPRATGRLGRGWRHHPAGRAGGGVTPRHGVQRDRRSGREAPKSGPEVYDDVEDRERSTPIPRPKPTVPHGERCERIPFALPAVHDDLHVFVSLEQRTDGRRQ